MVLPGATAMVEFPLRPQIEGSFYLLANMHCDQLTDVRGWMEVAVTSPASIANVASSSVNTTCTMTTNSVANASSSY